MISNFMNSRLLRTITLIICLIVLHITIKADGTFCVNTISLLTHDITAKTCPRVDANGKKCALVKLLLVIPGIKIEGNIVGKAEFHKGEYWAYLTDGSKQIRLKHDKYTPLMINFKDFNIPFVESGLTYEMIIDIHNDDPEEIIKLKEYAATLDQQIQQLQDSLIMVTETDDHKFDRALETNNKFLLKELAEKGYEKAYCPLANLYCNDNELYEAEKWAKKALYVEEDTTGVKFMLLHIKNELQKQKEETNKDSNRKQKMIDLIFQ